MWSEAIRRSSEKNHETGVEPAEVIDNKTVREESGVQDEETVKEQPAFTAKEIDWEERFFQICLALIQSSNYGSKYFNAGEIISRADIMVKVLKKHNENKDK